MNLTGVKPESIVLATEDKSAEDICTCWRWTLEYELYLEGKTIQVYNSLLMEWSDIYSIERILTCLSLVSHPHEKGDIPIEGMPSAQRKQIPT